MGRGAQFSTRQLTDQERANIDALNQQFLGQQQQVGNLLLPQYQSILNNPGLSPADKAAVTGQSQGALASAPCDCPVTAALSAGLRPGLFRMLWYWGKSRFPTCCCWPRNCWLSASMLARS